MAQFDLLVCIAKLQQVFVSYEFVSLANVHKSNTPKYKGSASTGGMAAHSTTNSLVPPPFPLSIVRMSEPLRRCKLCTLLPPCSHVTLHTLYDRVDRMRQYYPARDDETPPKALCPSYCHRGICANIQSIGRCRYAHPSGIHTIDTSALARRCATHTLPLPCLHCDHIQQSKHELREQQTAVGRIQQEVMVANKLLLDKETERYMFVREHTKTVKWGAARREYEEKLARLDATIQSLQRTVDTQQQDLRERHQNIQVLDNHVARGHSKGLGRGNASGSCHVISPPASRA
jgi:hypothetical protein